MKNLIPIIIFCWSISFLHAQGRETSLGFEFNIGRMQIRENALNSLVHKGSLIIAKLYFINESETGLSHKVVLRYGVGSLKSRFEENQISTYWNPQLHYSLTKLITSSISVGGYISGDYQVMEFENWDDSHTYWLTSYQIGPELKINNIPFKGLWANFSFPIMSFVSRSRNEITNKVDSGEFLDIFNLIHSTAAFVSLFKYQELDIHLGYTFINFQRINLSAISSLKYLRSVISDTREFTSASIVLGFLITYKFE